MRRAAFYLAMVTVLAGCSPEPPTQSDIRNSAKEKMRLVVEEATRRCDNESEKAILEGGKIFLNVKDSNIVSVGVLVVMNEQGNRVQISFTGERFEAGSIEELAEDMLRDLRGALTSREDAQLGVN